MIETNQYKCSKCGQHHDEWPALAFRSPTAYDGLAIEEKKKMAVINDDFCIITYPDQTDRFIRVILRQKVIDSCECLEYGVWVSLSEKSFKDYESNFQSENYRESYFGFLSNNIYGYESTLSIHVDVFTAKGGNRPEIVPRKDQAAQLFVTDYFNGISIEEAQRRIDKTFRK